MNRILKVNLAKIRYYCTVVEQANTTTTNNKRLVPVKKVKSKLDFSKLPPKTIIDAATISLLERLSLVDCESKQAIETLEAKLEFADQILQVDTTDVEPLITPLEDLHLRVREDKVNDGNCRDAILRSASITEDEYFVAPPGNIPLDSREDLLHKRSSNNVKKHSGLSN